MIPLNGMGRYRIADGAVGSQLPALRLKRVATSPISEASLVDPFRAPHLQFRFLFVPDLQKYGPKGVDGLESKH
jgi:hypothetical protein